MAGRQEKPPVVVAELGRPETPEENAARRAENSRKHRAKQTTANLVWALAASLGVVLVLVLIVVRPDMPATAPIDYATIAGQAQSNLEQELVTPVLPDGWTANRAELQRDPGGSLTWYIGFLTPGGEFIALEQGVGVEGGAGVGSGWLTTLLGSAQPTGTERIAGVEWQVFDQREADVSDNFAYSLYTATDESQYLLHGSASDGEFALLASAIVAEIPAGER